MSDGMSEAFGLLRRKEREGNAKPYIVFYVIKGTPKIKKFESLEKAKKFSAKIEAIPDKMNNWVDYIVKGRIL